MKKRRITPRTFRPPSLRLKQLHIPTMRARIPYVGWHVPLIRPPTLGRSPLMAISFATALAGILVTAAIWFAVKGVDSPPQFPQPGVYAGESRVGQDAPRALPGSLDYTFPSRSDTFLLQNLELGKDGLTNVFEISTPSTTDYIYIEAMTADGIVCPRLIISTSDISTATFINNRSDGHAFTFTGGSPDEVHIGTRGGRDRSATDQSYDKIILRGSGSNAQIKTLILNNIRGFAGACDFSNLKIGSLYVTNSVVGTGDGINVNDFGFGASVTIGTFTGTNNIETEISVR